jgi:cysteinyl-tRNA synthetase
MDDDLNTADAITAVFELVRELNSMANSAAASKQQLKAGLDLFNELTGVLGILYSEEEGGDIPQEVLDLVEKRKEARKAKDFALADKLRDDIAALGYTVKETRQGTEILPNS